MTKPQIYGGEQEFGVRAGTENVPGIVGIGTAIEIASRNLQERGKAIETMRRDVEEYILTTIPGARINGHHYHKLPGIISASFEGVDAQSLVLMLDHYGICVSAGSACSSNSLAPSHVLSAIGLSDIESLSTIRISLGHHTSTDDIDTLKNTLPKAVKLLRSSNT